MSGKRMGRWGQGEHAKGDARIERRELAPFGFLPQVLLDGLGGDPVGQGADLELVLAEEVGVVGGGEVGRQFADLGVDGLADGLLEVLDLGLLLGCPGCGRQGVNSVTGAGFSSAIEDFLLVYKDSTNFQDAYREVADSR